MNIAYLINNGVSLHTQNSPLIRIKQLIQHIRNRGHHVAIVALDGRQVIFTDEWNLDRFARLGISGKLTFNLFESAVRKSQGILKIPYYAQFDSCRFFDACSRELMNFDLLHEHCGLFGWGSMLASKTLHLPLLLDVEADNIKEFRSSWFSPPWFT